MANDYKLRVKLKGKNEYHLGEYHFTNVNDEPFYQSPLVYIKGDGWVQLCSMNMVDEIQIQFEFPHNSTISHHNHGKVPAKTWLQIYKALETKDAYKQILTLPVK